MQETCNIPPYDSLKDPLINGVEHALRLVMAKSLGFV